MHLWCVVPGNKSWKVIFIKFFVWKHKRACRLLSLEALPASQLCKSRGRCCWRFPGPAPAFGGVNFLWDDYMFPSGSEWGWGGWKAACPLFSLPLGQCPSVFSWERMVWLHLCNEFTLHGPMSCPQIGTKSK